MFNLLGKCNEWLGRYMFLIVLSALACGFFLPLSDSPALRTLTIALFAYMTLVTGLGASFRQFVKVAGRPWIPLWVLALVHLGTPAVTWCISLIFFADDLNTRLGYLIGASIPIGVTSVIWTSIVKGNVPASLVAVTLDTLAAPLLLPVYFKLIAGQTVALDYTRMVNELLLMITVPSIAGMAIYDLTGGKTGQFAKTVGGFTSKIAFFLVIAITASLVMPEISWNLAILKILLVTFLAVASGFAVGYLGSFVLKDRTEGAILTMIYNVGVRNIASGVVIAVTYFPPATAIPITLYMLFQQPLAAAVPHLFNRMKKRGSEPSPEHTP